MKVGFGYDIHPFKKGRKLILGGVQVPFERGLEGHSDGDVLLHSICDALLGASNLGDIGKHFPNKDKRYKDISSLRLLGEVKELLQKKELVIENIDSTIIIEEPNLSSFKQKMKVNIAQTLEVSSSQINIKATTNEGLGAIGKGKGIAAYAVALLKKDE
ncbi:MAG: 2-C-methyl-D-erythritol 2,4-cyclodiphosphate synthase [Candidatus Omnitrophica bacterium 4484_213]|nr:MAG: 2-C-methyl-D-erythritol 2,4-cyclodiphosphate synthase [Candidatus Omnitrophica bacterium 4484_213]